MRYLVFILLTVFISCKKENIIKQEKFVKAKIIPSKIDSIQTEEGVKEYMTAIDTNFKIFNPSLIEGIRIIPPSKRDSIMKVIAKRLNINKTFYKTDFDDNCYTDLLIYGGWGESLDYSSYVVMNFGPKKQSKIFHMTQNLGLLSIPQIITPHDQAPYLLIHSPEKMHGPDIKITDTINIKLAYRYGGFAEYNKQPVDNHIEKIEFESGPCFGSCPMYKITINKDQSAEFLAEHFNFSKQNLFKPAPLKNEGLFKGKIKNSDYNNLINLLNYIDFTKLKDEYSANWTDDASAILKITYDNGKTKTIDDYGKIGTYGLQSVYGIMDEFRFNQKWEKVPETVTK